MLAVGDFSQIAQHLRARPCALASLSCQACKNAAWTLLGVWASACFAFFAFFAFFGSDDRLQVQHAVRLHVEIRKKAFVLVLLLVLASVP